MSEKSTRLAISNISCASCKRQIESELNKTPGVLSIRVNIATEQASILYDEHLISMKEIRRIFDQIGYPARETEKTSSLIFLFFKVVICFILASTLFVVDMARMFDHHIMDGGYQFLIASVVQFYGGWGFYVQTIKSIKSKSLGMDVLVTLGTSVAYIFSSIAWLIGYEADLYFETSSVVIALVLIGKFLEARAKNQARSGMQSLLKMQPNTARVVVDGKDRTCSIDEIKKGDLIAIIAGEIIPVDGKIIQGRTSCDESMITGEAMAVHKEVGSKVVGGTLNKEGSILVECHEVGSSSVLGRMIELVEEAQNSKPMIQTLVDKISNIFIPIVLGIAIATFVLSWIYLSFSVAILNTVATLVIACPCALGLATPTVIMVSGARAAKKGILIKEYASLELAGKMKTIVFDKTGTVTEGKMEMTQSPSDQRVIDIAQSLAKHSSHPLAKSLGKGEIDVREIREEFGKGVFGKINEKKVYLGSETFLKDMGVIIDQEIPQDTVVLIGEEEKLIGIYAFKDKIREDAGFAISRLKEMDIETILLSGDKKIVVEAVGVELGFDKFLGEVSPEGKAEYVASIENLCGMVGDGVNDALALSKADVAIAMGSGTDVAMETAKIGIMQLRVASIIDLIELGRNTRKRVVQNIFFAFAYNIVALPFAAFGLVNPMIAAFAMSASSIIVVSNALRKY